MGRSRLLQAGFDDNDIEDGVGRNLLAAIVPGVYLIGRRYLSQENLRQAAAVHAEPAMVAARCAAESRGLLVARNGVVGVQTSRRGMAPSVKTLIPMERNRRPGLITVRSTAVLEPVDWDGVPTSPVPRMLVDIAASEPHSTLSRVWAQADYHRQLDLAAVDHELRSSRREGVPRVRELLLKHPGRYGLPAYYRAPSEVDFRQLVADAGLPDPEVNVPMRLAGRPYLADFFWRLLGLVAEVDDPSHRRPLARSRDAVRDVDFAAAGLIVVRFDTDRLEAAPAHSMDQLAAIIEQRRLILPT